MNPAGRAALRRAIGIAAAVFATGVPVAAQYGPASRAFDRVFGVENGAQAGQFSLQVYEGQTGSEERRNANEPAVENGFFTGFDPSASLSVGGRGASLGVTGGASVRRYGSGIGTSVLDAHGGAGVQFANSRTGFRAQESFGYAPFYQLLDSFTFAAPGLGSATGSSPEMAAVHTNTTTSTTMMEVGHQLTKSLLLTGSYDLRYTKFSGDTTALVGDIAAQRAAVRVNRQMGRYSVLHFDYAVRTSTRLAAGLDPLRTQDIGFGLDRQQQLNISRRSVVQFATGSSLVNGTDGQHFVLTGDGAFRQDLSRNWRATVNGRRGVDYIDGLANPVLSTTGVVAVEGAMGPRLNLLVNGGYGANELGVGPGATAFQTYSATARLRMLLTKTLGMFAEYGAYQHRFDSQAALPSGLERALNRSGFRVGVVLTTPIQKQRGTK